jgi:hypothetical protein
MSGYEVAKYANEIKAMFLKLDAAATIRAEVADELARICLIEKRRRIAGEALTAFAIDGLRSALVALSGTFGLIQVPIAETDHEFRKDDSPPLRSNALLGGDVSLCRRS